MNVLLTGGAGYIGIHTAVELCNAGYTPIIVDNFSNSSIEAIKRAEKLTGTSIVYYEGDVANPALLSDIFTTHSIDAVIHFAGLKAVGESLASPLKYYQTNLGTSLALLQTMQDHSVTKLVFSSSATVYGTPKSLPLTENSPSGINLTNPYGKTKFMIEQIIHDFSQAWPDLEATILRYFNPIGAHPSGQIGEDPKGIPNNLLPFVAQVAVGKRDSVQVFGDDYETPDGTGVRDYIHVVDLARGHIAALNHSKLGTSTYNLGTGKGTSVLQIISAFSRVCGHDIAYTINSRRPGDIAACYASAERALEELDWRAEKSIDEACKDVWSWQSQNPEGYTTQQ